MREGAVLRNGGENMFTGYRECFDLLGQLHRIPSLLGV